MAMAQIYLIPPCAVVPTWRAFTWTCRLLLAELVFFHPESPVMTQSALQMAFFLGRAIDVRPSDTQPTTTLNVRLVRGVGVPVRLAGSNWVRQGRRGRCLVLGTVPLCHGWTIHVTGVSFSF